MKIQAIKHYRDEIGAHLKDEKVSWKASKGESGDRHA
jgi:hypothetical protein